MDAPMCRRCGERHWGICADIVIPVVDNVPIRRAVMANIKEEKEVSGTGSTYRYRDPEKRREYMRELMRKRRARG